LDHSIEIGTWIWHLVFFGWDGSGRGHRSRNECRCLKHNLLLRMLIKLIHSTTHYWIELILLHFLLPLLTPAESLVESFQLANFLLLELLFSFLFLSKLLFSLLILLCFVVGAIIKYFIVEALIIQTINDFFIFCVFNFLDDIRNMTTMALAENVWNWSSLLHLILLLLTPLFLIKCSLVCHFLLLFSPLMFQFISKCLIFLLSLYLWRALRRQSVFLLPLLCIFSHLIRRFILTLNSLIIILLLFLDFIYLLWIL